MELSCPAKAHFHLLHALEEAGGKLPAFFRPSSETSPIDVGTTDCEGLLETRAVVFCFLRVANSDTNQCAVPQEDLGPKVSAKMSTYLI